jgi:hypothetical protein
LARQNFRIEVARFNLSPNSSFCRLCYFDFLPVPRDQCDALGDHPEFKDGCDVMQNGIIRLSLRAITSVFYTRTQRLSGYQ